MAYCKYYKKQRFVSYDSGATWTGLNQFEAGDLYQRYSTDCDASSDYSRWVPVENGYICVGKDLYRKEVYQVSTDDGLNYRNAYPTTFRAYGEPVEVDSEYCNNKFEGHYVYTSETYTCDDCYQWDSTKRICVKTCPDPTPTPSRPTGGGGGWDGRPKHPVPIPKHKDPIKIVKCDSNSTVLLASETQYYVSTANEPMENGHITYQIRLYEAIIGECVTVIGSFAFYNCSSLTSVTIPDSVTTISNNAFEGCNKLATLDVPSGVTTIGDNAFYGCGDITIRAITPPTLGASAFSTNSLIYLPCGSIDDYKTASGWSGYTKQFRAIPETSTCNGDRVTMTSTTNNVYAVVCNCNDILQYGEIREYIPSYNEHMKSIYINGESVSVIKYRAFDEGSLKTASSVTMSYGVSTIENSLFAGYTGLTSFVMPDSVTSLGSSTFSNCTSLTAVTLSNMITEIPNGTFYGCSSLSSYTINSGVTSIGNQVFQYCSGLTSISIPNTVTSIGNSAFYGCGITGITIPSGVTAINNGTFRNSKLTEITIPSGVTSIGQNSFQNCTGLTEVTIPSGVTSIGDYAFSSCTSLSSVTINATTPPTLGTGAFDGTNNCEINVPCDSVATYRAASGWSNYASRIKSCPGNYKVEFITVGGTSNTVPCDSSPIITSAETKAFSASTSASIGACVNEIGTGAFYRFSGLTEIEIPNNITKIGNSGFAYCEGFTSITIPDSVTDIGDTAFYDCMFARNIKLPANITSIKEKTFKWCDNLSAITIPNSVETIGNEAFSDCYALESIAIPNNVTSIGNKAFYSCESLSSVTIGNSVTSIGDYAFNGCTSLPVENYIRYADTYLVEATNKTQTSYTVKNGVRWIGDNAFSGCTKLSSFTISDSVISIGIQAFRFCSGLTSIDIPSGVTSIGNYAFYYCSGLTSIDIPSGVTSIGNYAFYGCKGLTSITINATTPQEIGSDTFSYTNNCPIYVPCGTKGLYKSTNRWSIYADRIQEQNGCPVTYKLSGITYDSSEYVVDCLNSGTTILKRSEVNNNTKIAYIGTCTTEIDMMAFNPVYGLPYLTDVYIASTVTSIGNSAFAYCSGITNCTFDSNSQLTNIGQYAFQRCSGLTSIDIPDSVTTLGYACFSGCTSLTSVNIPTSTTVIGDYAFMNCRSLTGTLTIPDSVATIGRESFESLTFTSIHIGSGVTEIRQQAFYGCSRLTGITITATTPPEIDSGTFSYTNNCPIYVPAASVDAYKNAPSAYWYDYRNRILPIP